MKSKIKVGIIFGGKSAEHDVSISSAQNVYKLLDKNKYEAKLIYISKNGSWKFNVEPNTLLSSNAFISSKISSKNNKSKIEKQHIPTQKEIQKLDVMFPLLHGPYGEDGTIQGLLKLSGIPFVGADVLGSAVGMNKDVSKRLLNQAGICVAKYLVLSNLNKKQISYNLLVLKLGRIFFVKPLSLGSSVGISRVTNETEFNQSLTLAFEYDNKVIIEEEIRGRELECAVLGNDMPIASVVGEVIPTHSFYSYEAKYLDPNGARIEIPAKISQLTQKKIQKLAVEVFQILCCQGMARADFFLSNNKIYVNEINTIPGFTNISMFPMLWQASGLNYQKLLSKLIDLAMESSYKMTKFKA